MRCFCASECMLSRWSRLHLQSLAPINMHCAWVVGYTPLSICVIHKERAYPSSRDINRLMMIILIKDFDYLSNVFQGLSNFMDFLVLLVTVGNLNQIINVHVFFPIISLNKYGSYPFTLFKKVSRLNITTHPKLNKCIKYLRHYLHSIYLVLHMREMHTLFSLTKVRAWRSGRAFFCCIIFSVR
jgi:hypothetical protein